LKKIKLLNWINQNQEKWDMICGIKEASEEEIFSLYYDIFCLALSNIEFKVVLTVILSRYRDILFPPLDNVVNFNK